MNHHPSVHRERRRQRHFSSVHRARDYLRAIGIRFWRRALKAGVEAGPLVDRWRELCNEAEAAILAVRQHQSYWPVVRELARTRLAFIRQASRELRMTPCE